MTVGFITMFTRSLIALEIFSKRVFLGETNVSYLVWKLLLFVCACFYNEKFVKKLAAATAAA